jgi:hypothetical protein
MGNLIQFNSYGLYEKMKWLKKTIKRQRGVQKVNTLKS